MLSINLDQETESYLTEIIAQENTTSEELLKKLIYQHWQSLMPSFIYNRCNDAFVAFTLC